MKYVYSGSPQIRCSLTTRKIMLHVCIALLPSCVAGCIFFGWGALLNLVVATVSAVAAEVVYRLCCKTKFVDVWKQFDFTSVVTGLLVGMNAYANIKWYALMLSSIFAIVVAKGRNAPQPLAGYAFKDSAQIWLFASNHPTYR